MSCFYFSQQQQQQQALWWDKQLLKNEYKTKAEVFKHNQPLLAGSH